MTEFETKLLAVLEKIAENTMNINDSLCEHWEIGDFTYQKPMPFQMSEPKSYDQMLQTIIEKTEALKQRNLEEKSKREFRKQINEKL